MFLTCSVVWSAQTGHPYDIFCPGTELNPGLSKITINFEIYIDI